MKQTDPFINTALLGTANRELSVAELPQAIQPFCEAIRGQQETPESTFYKQAALAFVYQRAGRETLTEKSLSVIDEAPAEEKPYLSKEAGQIISLLQSQRLSHLLLYAYRKAVREDKLIPPEKLPKLLHQAFEKSNPQKGKEQMLLSALAGKRGEWLLPLLELPAWNSNEQDSWDTATHALRKEILSRMRRDDPAAARELLQGEWKNSGANQRDDLLNCLRINLSKDDEEMLESIMQTDRSSTVKDTARELLGSLPDSGLTKTYCELLRGKLSYRTLLGWSYQSIVFAPEMKKLGLEEVSRKKKESDDRFLLRQLAERVPLSFWCELFQTDAEKAATRLAKHSPFEEFDVAVPIRRFQDSLWAYYTLKAISSKDHSDLLGMLTPEQREEVKLVPDNKYYLMDIPEDEGKEGPLMWGANFSGYILRSAAKKSSYYLSRDIAERIALHLRPESLTEFEKKQDAEQQASNFFSHLKECMELKQQIDRVFG